MFSIVINRAYLREIQNDDDVVSDVERFVISPINTYNSLKIRVSI